MESPLMLWHGNGALIEFKLAPGGLVCMAQNEATGCRW